MFNTFHDLSINITLYLSLDLSHLIGFIFRTYIVLLLFYFWWEDQPFKKICYHYILMVLAFQPYFEYFKSCSPVTNITDMIRYDIRISYSVFKKDVVLPDFVIWAYSTQILRFFSSYLLVASWLILGIWREIFLFNYYWWNYC